ncbi:hypothetical protein [Demequina mangrovi]|uniref:Uncharacterized protein n=1 Tax=Demequina mangrovi TaxID=1043493 RepID=A0A1H6VEM3_9MICO|nr:hypothetical protein [Demequina mangrovi]SEI98732.1 hypothetical protein SAMN05421637_0654 [Demequina mangrovi]
MTDQGRPLSRRQRREVEARQSGQDQPTTPIVSPVAGPPTHPDGTPLTRKERRELERQARPMETWTREEELIATGQLPAMTPELLDAQELIARRDTAEPAAPEADAAADAVEQAEEPEAIVAPEPEPEPEPEAVAEPEPEPEAETVGEPEPEPAEEVALAASFEPEPETAVEADPEATAAFTFEPEPEPAAEQEPEPERVQLTSPWSGFAAEVAAAQAAPAEEAEEGEQEPAAEAEPEPVATEPTPSGAMDTIPEEYRHLFPPGSLQARRLEDRSSEPFAQPPAPAPAAQDEAPAAPQAADDEAVEDPAAEIRRLTAEAMAGITRAQQAHRAPAPEPVEVEERVEAEPEAETVVEEQAWPAATAEADAQDTEVLDPAEVYAHAAQESALGLGRTVAAPEPQPELEPADLEQQPVADEEPAPTPSSGPIVPAGLRPVGPAAAAATAWDSHPLTQAQPREVADYAPSDDIPIPDFTKIMHGYAGSSSSAGTAPEGHVGDEPSPTDLPVSEPIRRPLPEEHEEGAHHFAWAHLAVIGAVAFLLGVLVWHLTGNAG